MKQASPLPVMKGPEEPRPAGSAPADLMTWFIADWSGMVFFHYRVPATVLQPQVPHRLDLHKGSAWVSLVFFRLEKMRPPGTGLLGRALLRPISDHVFLNVRTYVRGAAGPGIHFLAEWIPNRLSAWIGPRTYGLPYRLGTFDADLVGAGNGIGRINLKDSAHGAGLNLTFPVRADRLARAQPNTAEEFLLERYTAYTSRAGVDRAFRVAHEPWEFHAVDWLRADITLLKEAFPWFAHADYDSAHLTPGLRDVRMSRPVRLHAPVAVHANAPRLVPTKIRVT